MTTITCLDLSQPRKTIMRKVNDVIFNFKMDTDKAERTMIKYAITETTITLFFTGIPVHAGVKESMIRGFQPIVDLIQGLGYPVCLCTMTMGAVTMSFNRKKGVSLIRDGGISYIVLQFVPMLMQILAGVGSEIK